MSLPYFTGMPQASEDPSVSQPKIKDNFDTINTALARNHIGLTESSNEGLHTVVQMEEQGSDPSALASFGALYTKTDKNLYYRDSSGNILQLTNDATAATTGSVTLGPILMQWAVYSAPSAITTVTFPTAFSGTPYNIQCTYTGAGGGVALRTNNLTSTNFQLICTAPTQIAWFAIGPA